MENKKILMIKHSPMHVKFTNGFYRNQLGNDVNPDDVIFIDATSRNKDLDFINEISPFFIGPVVASDGKVSKTFESFWQFSKVYEGECIFSRHIEKRKYEDISFIASDALGNPTEDWFKVRDYGFSTNDRYRHPFKGKPLYQYYIENGSLRRLDYIESRKRVYIPVYAKLVANTKAFKYLKSLVDEGKTIAIVDFDAYNYYNEDYMRLRYLRDKKKYPNMTYTVDDYLNIKTMKDVVNFKGLLQGHGFVLKMLLQGDIEVNGDEVIDNVGILD